MALSIRRSKQRYREGTAAALAAANPILFKGEEAYETDTGRRTTGDGVSYYLSLRPQSDAGWQPRDNNFKAVNFPPRYGGYNFPAPAGFHFMQKVWIPAGTTITYTHLSVSTAGAAVAGYYMAVYEMNGTRSGMSAAQTTLMESVGLKTFAMAAPIAPYTFGRWVYVAFVFTSASSIPYLLCATGSADATNIGTVSPNKTCGYIGAGAPPAASADFSFLSDYFEFWVAVT